MTEQGDGMADVTKADRTKAVELIAIAGLAWHTEAVPAIAAALAEERKKARVPFLAVAEQYESHVRACESEGLDADGLAAAAVDIRRAAEQG